MTRKLQELVVLAKNDPKKTGVLGVLALILVVLGGRHILQSVPTSANAGQEAVDAARDQALGLADISSIVQTGPSVRIPMPSGGMRDLFRFDERFYPTPSSDPDDGERSGKSDDRSDDPTPEEAVGTDSLTSVRAEAERFRLTSTLLGTHPIAVVSIDEGASESREYMLRIGEAFQGFTLVSISHRSAVIEKHGHTITLHVED